MWLSLVLLAAAMPERIISTAPSFTEMLFAVGAGEKVVAVSTYCHFPASVDKLPRIGSYLKPNVEAIVRLKPDLVLVHAEQPQVAQQLAALGIKTLALRNTGLEETLRSATEIGKAVGREKAGEALEAKLRAELAAMAKRTATGRPKSILFVVGRTPGRLDGMVVVGKGSFLNELMQVAGGRNVMGDSPVTYPKISLEGVMRLDPDVIVDMGDMAVTTGVTQGHINAVVRLWQGQQGLRAVQAKKVFAVAADIYVVPGARVTEAAEAFWRMLQ